MCACYFFFCKQKTAYEMRISDWSSDVCSSDLRINNPWMIGALLSSGALAATGVLEGRMPGWIFAVGQILIGYSIGARFRRDIVRALPRVEIGRASCRERVCQYESLSVVAVSLTKKKKE